MTDQLALENFEDAIRTYTDARTTVEDAKLELVGAHEDLTVAKENLKAAVFDYIATGVSEEDIERYLEKYDIENLDLNY